VNSIRINNGLCECIKGSPIIILSFLLLIGLFSAENVIAQDNAFASITLFWIAPGDDGNTGSATLYDVRYSTEPITSANWNSATQATGEPAPRIAGTLESYKIGNLNQNTTYYFAMKTADEIPNWSEMSDVLELTTSTYDFYSMWGLITLINCLYGEGDCIIPEHIGDVNGDCEVNLLDILYLIKFLYGNPQGPAPVEGC